MNRCFDNVRRFQLVLKRIFDFVAAFCGLLIVAPLLLLVALAVRSTMGSPVLFRQPRAGYQGRPFIVLKFRTMLNIVGPGGQTLPDAQRITRLGRLLRRTSLDELPQLWNVLKGNMSFVGPRPLLTEYLPYYTDRERQRHSVRPGITGLAQVSGRNLLSWDERLELDVQYVERASLWLDIKIMSQTLRKVIAQSDLLEVPSSKQGTLVQCRQANWKKG